MKQKKVIAGLLAAALVMGTLAGCGGKEDTKESSGGTEQVFNFSTVDVVVGLNPILNTTAPDNRAHNIVCEPLVRNRSEADNTSAFVPGSAETWDISEDGLTYTFHLREDGKWNDGEPITAKDYEYTLKMMADPVVAGTNAWLFDGIIENFKESLYSEGKTPEDIAVKATDDYTLEVKLVNPSSYFIELVGSLYPVRQDKYEEWGAEYGTAADKIICSGPFEVESWNQNTGMVLKKNENYWNAENVKLETINYKVIQDTATAVQAFINGEIDAVSTTDTNWGKTIEESGSAVTQLVPVRAPDFLMFNVGNEYLQNAKIRQALSISFDREAFVDDLFDGFGEPIYSVMPDSMLVGETEYHELVEDKNYFVTELQKANPDAKKLLQEGLEELGKGSDTSQVTIRYASRGTSELAKKIAEWFKQIWEDTLGINVEIDMMEWNIMWERIDAGDYDIAYGGWGPYYNEPSGILSLFEPDTGYFNSEKTGWADEDSQKYKEIMDQAKITVDDKEKAELYLQAEELLVGNALIAPEYLATTPTYVSDRVADYFVSTNGSTDWSLPYIK